MAHLEEVPLPDTSGSRELLRDLHDIACFSCRKPLFHATDTFRKALRDGSCADPGALLTSLGVRKLCCRITVLCPRVVVAEPPPFTNIKDASAKTVRIYVRAKHVRSIPYYPLPEHPRWPRQDVYFRVGEHDANDASVMKDIAVSAELPDSCVSSIAHCYHVGGRSVVSIAIGHYSTILAFCEYSHAHYGDDVEQGGLLVIHGFAVSCRFRDIGLGTMLLDALRQTIAWSQRCALAINSSPEAEHFFTRRGFSRCTDNVIADACRACLFADTKRDSTAAATETVLLVNRPASD